MHPPRLLSDLRRVVAGLGALGRYSCSKEEISLSISSFSSDGLAARSGERSRYEVTIANNAAQHRWGRLLIDINLESNPTHPDGHFAYFEKSIFVRSREAQTIEVVFDWRDEAEFRVDGVAFPPHALWIGPCEARDAYYVVRALLFVDEGSQIEELTLAQRLAR